MINLSAVGSASGAGEYYSQDNYYTTSELTEASEWFGNGAEALGLHGVVEEQRAAAACPRRHRQAVSMHPRKHINKAKGMVCIPGAKGHGDRWLRVPDEVMVELTALPEIYPRDWSRKPENLRLFGYADRGGPRKLWAKACKAAGIEQIPFHPAGRHGFGQEMNVREKVDEKAAGAFGGWSDLNLMRNTYTHAEDTETKINEALRRGLMKAEIKTKLKLRKEP